MRKYKLILYILFSLILVCVILPQALAWDGSEPLIVDHRAVQEFDQIPDYWLEKAKELTVHYGHTSHGGQIIAGLNHLRDYVDQVRYNVDIARRNSTRTPNLPAEQNPPALRIWEEGAHPSDYWEGEGAQNGTRQVLNSGLFNLSGWAWCGQVIGASEEYIQEYLDTISMFEEGFPNIKFFYMTGHRTISGPEFEFRYLRLAFERNCRNNNMIREYCINNNKILFDFADIESHDLSGEYHPETSDKCEWAYDWCLNHPEDCQNIPSNDWGGACGSNICTGCAHSHGLNCVIKAKAFWWMMARLAGWDGRAEEPIIVDHTAVQQFDQIPDYWLEKAKELTVHYGHTSHGSQIIAGLNYLEAYIDPVKYKFKSSISYASNGRDPFSPTRGLPSQENPPALLMWEEGAHPSDYWEGEEAQNGTRQVLNSGLFNLSGWSWCGEHGDAARVLAYLDAMTALESESPNVKFFYMTGASSPYRIQNNDMIREHCRNNNKILFDFADIERHDPDGVYRSDGDSRGGWCEEWVRQNPDVYQNIPETTEVGGGGDGWMRSSHAHGLFTIMKAQAFWWMMARLAGWDGAVSERMLGDVNGDGQINVADALKTLDRATFKIDLQGNARWAANVNGDVNGNGEPNIAVNDALLILDHAVGLIDKFPIE